MTGSFGMVAALVVLISVHAVGHAQQARDQSVHPAGIGVLTGRVVTAGDTASPVRRVVLSLSGAPLRTNLLAVTDDDGRFVFRGLPEGRFTLDARKAGFVREVYGAASVGATTGVAIPVGSGSTDVTMMLVRAAAISGHIRMPAGAPASNIRLQVLRWAEVRGRRQLVSARGGAFGVAGDGRFRIGGLPPGEYVLVAYPFGRAERRLFDQDGPGAVVTLAPVYLPGTVDPAQARPVSLAAGDDRVVDMSLDYVATGFLGGRILGPDGLPLPGAQVSAVPLLPAVPQPAPVRAAADGSFVLPPLAPGAYTLVARGAPSGLPPAPAGSLVASQPRVPLWAHASVQVAPASRHDALALHLQPGRMVRGRLVTTEAAATTTSVPSLMVLLRPADDVSTVVGLPAAETGSGRSFEIPGVAPGRYQLDVSIPAALQSEVFVIGMDANGQDVLDGAFAVGVDRDIEVAVLVTTKPSLMEITVRDSGGAVAPGRPLIMFPRDPALRMVPSRRVIATRSGADGITTIRALPDGEYLVAPLMDVPDASAQTAEWFDALVSRATPITVRDGQRTPVTVVVGRQ